MLEEAEIPCDKPLKLEMKLHDVTLDQILPILVEAASGERPNNKQDLAYELRNGGVFVSSAYGIYTSMVPTLRVYDVTLQLAKMRRNRQLLDLPPVHSMIPRSNLGTRRMTLSNW